MAFYRIPYPYSDESRRGASLGGSLSGGLGGGFREDLGGGFGGDLGEGFRGDLGGGFRGDLGGGFRGNLGGGFRGDLGGGLSGGSSSGFSFSSFAAFGGAQSSGFGGYAGSDKQTMQNLNDRLAAYLEKVKALEAANTDLEIKIREWYEKQVGVGADATASDYSKYYDTINDLKSKILVVKFENSGTELHIDNARMAIDDFNQKKEIELSHLKHVEADIHALRTVLDELSLSRSNLEFQEDSISEELAYLKKNHEEEMHAKRSSSAGQVDVQMNAAPGINLTKVLNDMRTNYEDLAEKNRADAEALFAQKSNELKTEISAGVEQVETSKTEITDLRRNLKSFELELQSLLALKKNFEDTLAETEADYGGQLHQIQLIITGLEEQLHQIRSDTEHQSQEYRELLDIKTRLEMEIETYRHLLEGELGKLPIQSSSSESASSSSTVSAKQTSSSSNTISQTSPVDSRKAPTRAVMVKTIIEEVVDGKVVSSRSEQVEGMMK
ncbi:keratin, type I cytoskeletal 47 kDa-like [Rana temporaria]|uniref:keratin, type I cytoskeletal 47 kDa-like n=1 Tax=Rana temporaria TaxID=8407 RepID=UPI001AADAAE5|nr:keratin, type I cytoskeletal 47 kDa-like [Rana temporaria]